MLLQRREAHCLLSSLSFLICDENTPVQSSCCVVVSNDKHGFEKKEEAGQKREKAGSDCDSDWLWKEKTSIEKEKREQTSLAHGMQ